MIRAPRKRVVIVIALVTAGVFGGVCEWLAGSAAHARAAPGSPSAAPVETALVARADVPVYLDALGTVQASQTATITTRVDGQLRKLNFVEGSEVAAGQLLAQIDPRPFEAQLAEAQAKQAQDRAQLENARRDLQRYNLLAPDNYTSKQAFDATRAQVAELTAQIKADQAAIDAAKTQLDYTSITAPFSGRTGIRLVDEGNIVRASDTGGIVVLAQLQPICVIFTLPQDQLAAVSAAMTAGPVAATALDDDGKTELDRGTVSLIDNRIDPATATVRLKATFPNQSQRLWPGQFVNVRLLTQTLRNVLTVPPDAILQGPNGSFTYVVKRDNTVEMRPIDVGHETDARAQINAGLKAGERVVTRGQYRLQPDARVQIGTADARKPASGRKP